jgi:hypothetical protein
METMQHHSSCRNGQQDTLTMMRAFSLLDTLHTQSVLGCMQ